MSESPKNLIQQHRLIPVVEIHHEDHALPLIDALADGGLPIAEITLRTNCALASIRRAAHKDHFLVGAGTVLNLSQAKQAIDAGARFIVSPGLDPQVVEHCLENAVPVFPGVSTASEVQLACNLGLDVAKFFPAEAIGGVTLLKALAGPFHQMKFVPTGGINEKNLLDYLSLDCVAAVGGSWMVKPKLYVSGDFSTVRQLTAAAVKRINESR